MNRRLEIPCIPCPSCCSLLPKGGISYHERGGVCFRDMLQGNDRNVRLQRPWAGMVRGYKSVEASR